MPNSNWKNLTDDQFTTLMSIIGDGSGYEVHYPLKTGDECVVKSAIATITWRIAADGSVSQSSQS